MWFKLALFSALFSIASSKQSPHREDREVGVHEASLSTHATLDQAPDQIPRQLTADFNWGIAPREGFPIIAFNANTDEGEVELMYDYTGTLMDGKNISMSLFQNDCLTPADSSLRFAADYGTLGELSVAIDIIEETIAESVHFSVINSTAAVIAFCARADYNYKTNSMNFHETNVTIHIDLTAGFTLKAIEEEVPVDDSRL
jgi:hypothetical protein